jgi:hypothetical protein
VCATQQLRWLSTLLKTRTPPVPLTRSGSPLDPECPPESHKLSPAAAAYLVIDTNVALHQLDFLEHAAVTDVIVTKTVLEEVGGSTCTWVYVCVCVCVCD